MSGLLTPADIAQMVADACEECLSSIDQVLGADWHENGEIVLRLTTDGKVYYQARATFTVDPPQPGNDR